MSEKRTGISLKFTIPLPDKYSPIQVSMWTERDKLPDEKEEDMIVNIGKELVKDMKTVAESLIVEVLEEEKKIMDDLNDD